MFLTMDNLNSKYNDEIDLVLIFQILWDNKWKLITISFIAGLIGFALNFNRSNIFEVSIPSGLGKNSTFIDFILVNDVLKENNLHLFTQNPNGYKVNSLSIFEMFVSEFNDNEEIKSVLEKNEVIQQLIINLDEYDKKKIIEEHAKYFKINFDRGLLEAGKKNNFTFKWYNVEDGINILKESLILTLSNVKLDIIKDISKSDKYIMQKNKRELVGLFVELDLVQQALNNEISISKSEDSSEEKQLLLKDYVDIKARILSIERDLSLSQLSSSLKVIENLNSDNWIEFNLSFAELKSQTNYMFNIILFVILGLVIGIIFIIISNYFIKHKVKVKA